MGIGKDAANRLRLRVLRFSAGVSGEFQPAESGREIVAMMQTAKSRHGDDLRACRCARSRFSACRRLLAQPQMGSILVVVADVFVHQSLQMTFVQHDHVIEEVVAAVTDEALGHAILPRTSEAGTFRLDAEAGDRFDDLRTEVRSAVEDQIFRSGVVRERLAQLLVHPRARRMPGDVEMKNAPSIMRDDEEAVQHTESERRHGEKIHCGDGLTVVGQERRPSPGRLGVSRRFPHPAQDGSLGDLEAEHLQFAVNARRAPGGILGNHAKDELAQFSAGWLPARANASSRDPFPVQPESGAMPANDGVRLHDKKRLLPAGPEPAQHDPEQPIQRSETRLRMPGFQHGELLPQSEVFKKKIAAGAE